MKKTTAIFGTLALASTLIAANAMADTSTTTVTAAAPTLADKFVLNYWGLYMGPSVGKPSEYTNDSSMRGAVGSDGVSGAGGEIQYLDSTLTAGYKINDQLILQGNYRFFVRPSMAMDLSTPGVAAPFFFRNRDPWVNLVAPKLIHVGSFNMWADIRFYVPLMSSAKMMGAFRTTQISTFDVPKTRLSLGLYTYARANMLTDAGASGALENIDLDVSPFLSYQVTPTIAATFWTDVVQATYANVGNGDSIGSLPTGWDNETVDMSVGIGWDVTPKININPQLTFYPGYATLSTTTIGAIISAKFL